MVTDILTITFWIALIEIIGINIILSGDNAVVIALACRNLGEKQQKIGIFLGSFAAVILRIIFTLFISFLIETPYIKIIGGLLLFWIGFKLLTEDEVNQDSVHSPDRLWSAVWTIMVADAVMSLDNVIAVAAAAKGNYPLLILGLVISIPLVVYGATLILKLISKFPIIVTLGAALIGYIGADVIIKDVSIEPYIAANGNWLFTVAPLVGLFIPSLIARFFKSKDF